MTDEQTRQFIKWFFDDCYWSLCTHSYLNPVPLTFNVESYDLDHLDAEEVDVF